jgi:hypothetical protein
MLIIYSELEVDYNSGFYRRTGCLSMKTIFFKVAAPPKAAAPLNPMGQRVKAAREIY